MRGIFSTLTTPGTDYSIDQELFYMHWRQCISQKAWATMSQLDRGMLIDHRMVRDTIYDQVNVLDKNR